MYMQNNIRKNNEAYPLGLFKRKGYIFCNFCIVATPPHVSSNLYYTRFQKTRAKGYLFIYLLMIYTYFCGDEKKITFTQVQPPDIKQGNTHRMLSLYEKNLVSVALETYLSCVFSMLWSVFTYYRFHYRQFCLSLAQLLYVLCSKQYMDKTFSGMKKDRRPITSSPRVQWISFFFFNSYFFNSILPWFVQGPVAKLCESTLSEQSPWICVILCAVRLVIICVQQLKGVFQESVKKIIKVPKITNKRITFKH